MSQSINNLTVGTKIKIPETFNNVTTYQPYTIMAAAQTNPYGSNKILVHRSNLLTIESAPSIFPMYSDSPMDTYLTETFIQRFASGIISCFATSNVVVLDANVKESYTLGRIFFLPSYTEMGGTLEGDTSVDPGYFDTNDKRKIPDVTGETRMAFIPTRNVVASNAYATWRDDIGILYSSYSASTTGFDVPLVLANLRDTVLVSDSPDEDGMYMLLPSEGDPYMHVEFDCSMGEVDTRPTKIRLDVAYEGVPIWDAIQVCNNYDDDTPTWENAALGVAHSFTNAVKTAENWHIGVKIHVKSENTLRIYEPMCIYQKEVY